MIAARETHVYGTETIATEGALETRKKKKNTRNRKKDKQKEKNTNKDKDKKPFSAFGNFIRRKGFGISSKTVVIILRMRTIPFFKARYEEEAKTGPERLSKTRSADEQRTTGRLPKPVDFTLMTDHDI